MYRILWVAYSLVLFVLFSGNRPVEQSKRAHLFLIHIGPFSPVRILASKFLTSFTHCIPAVTSKGLPPVHGPIQCYTVHTVLLLHVLSMGLSIATDGIDVALHVDG